MKNLPLLDEAKIETVTASYRGWLGAVKSIDDQVGKIVKTLKKNRELNNTVIIFNSDNGYPGGVSTAWPHPVPALREFAADPLIMRAPGSYFHATVSNPSDAGHRPDDPRRAKAKAKPVASLTASPLLAAAKKVKKLPYRDIPMEAERPLFKFTTPLTQFDLPFYGVKTKPVQVRPLVLRRTSSSTT